VGVLEPLAVLARAAAGGRVAVADANRVRPRLVVGGQPRPGALGLVVVLIHVGHLVVEDALYLLAHVAPLVLHVLDVLGADLDTDLAQVTPLAGAAGGAAVGP